MLRLRKGDAWKAALLCLLIAATGWFIFRTFSQTKAGQPPTVAAPPSKPEPGPQASASKEMFAPRTHLRPGLGRIAAAPDPFRPYVSTEPVTVSEQASAQPAQPPPPPAPELAGVRLSGIILAREPVAVLRTGEQRHFLHPGDVLTEGWRLAEIGPRSVTLAKGGNRVKLALSQER